MTFRTLWNRLRAFVPGMRADQASVEEFAFHLDMEMEKLLARGVMPDEARRQAVLAFGGVDAAREAARDARGGRWIADAAQDLRHAVRQMARAPAFTLVAMATLALGVGATTAIYSVVRGVLLRPMPFPDGDRIMVVWEQDHRSGTVREPSSWPDLIDLRAEASALQDLAALRGIDATLQPADGDPVQVPAVAVTPSYFALTGTTPDRGRTFTDAENAPGGPRVALLSAGVWRDRFGGDSGIVGKTVRLNDESYTVIGVLPKGADFGLDQLHARAAYHAAYRAQGDVAIWVPLQASEAEYNRDTHPFLALARVAPGAGEERAREQVRQIGARLEQAYPGSNTARGFDLELLAAVVFAPFRPALMLLTVAVALVLLVAVVNVANLQLARGTKVSPWAICPSMPRMARFILASRQVV